MSVPDEGILDQYFFVPDNSNTGYFIVILSVPYTDAKGLNFKNGQSEHQATGYIEPFWSMYMKFAHESGMSLRGAYEEEKTINRTNTV